jgi:hypothetical protein
MYVQEYPKSPRKDEIGLHLSSLKIFNKTYLRFKRLKIKNAFKLYFLKGMRSGHLESHWCRTVYYCGSCQVLIAKIILFQL